MTDHSHYEELAALAAGGHLSKEEYDALQDHLATCEECTQIAQEFRQFVKSGLPILESQPSGMWERINSRPEPGARARFLARARTEGVRFSAKISQPTYQTRSRLVYGTATLGVIAATLLIAVFYGHSALRKSSSGTQSDQQALLLKQEKDALTTRLLQQEQELAQQQSEIGKLRGQLGLALRGAEDLRRESESKGVRLEQSSSQTAQLLDELENSNKQLAASSAEIARINQLLVTDTSSLDAQQKRIREISDQLRIADATLAMERQFTSAGKDIRELLVARQLHVVDIRDTDANGKQSQAFARVFVTEGKSLMFFAFDLNDPRAINAKARFQVWGEQLGRKGSVRSLGVLAMDDKAQNRWALKVENPSLLSDVNSVFVTVASADRTASGPRLLYAYLGAPNHS